MFLYNVTYNIDKDIEEQWFDYMRLVHIPKIMATGYFQSFKTYKLLNVEDEGLTFSIQFVSDGLDKIEAFLKNDAQLLAAEHNVRFRNKHVAFRSVLQEI